MSDGQGCHGTPAPPRPCSYTPTCDEAEDGSVCVVCRDLGPDDPAPLPGSTPRP